MNSKLNLLHFRLFYFLLAITMFCSGISWSLAYIDYTNMINNGYVNDDSITFIQKNEKQISLNNGKTNYLLFQFNPWVSVPKYLYMNGNPKLPPITYINNGGVPANVDVAIIGKNADQDLVPSQYTVIGFFETPDSYLLNDDIWLIPANRKINPSNGKMLIFETPDRNPKKVFAKSIKIDSIQKVQSNLLGTYSSPSNQIVIISLKVCFLFMVLAFLIGSTSWVMKEKQLVRVLFMIGIPINSVFAFLMRYKFVPFFVFSGAIGFISYLIQIFIFLLWSISWIFYLFYSILFFDVYVIVIIISLCKNYGKGKRWL